MSAVSTTYLARFARVAHLHLLRFFWIRGDWKRTQGSLPLVSVATNKKLKNSSGNGRVGSASGAKQMGGSILS